MVSRDTSERIFTKPNSGSSQLTAGPDRVQQLESILNSVYSSRSWKITRPLRTAMSLTRLLKIESLSLMKHLRTKSVYLTKLIGLYRVAYFTKEGELARNLSVKLCINENYSSAMMSISRSNLVRNPFLDHENFQVKLVITQDISFDKYLIFKFCLTWVQRSDSSTIYCDFIEPGRTDSFEKGRWDFLYHRSISLLAPIYLESLTECSLMPIKLDGEVVRIRSLTDYVQKGSLSPRAGFTREHRSRVNGGVSVIIPTANKTVVSDDKQLWLIRDLVKEISRIKKFPIQFVIIHNGNMTKREMTILKSYGDVQLVRFAERRFNISKKINLGVKYAKYENLILANDDIQGASRYWIEQLVLWLNETFVGIAVPKIHFTDGTLQYAGIEIHSESDGPHILGYRTKAENQGYGFSFEVPRLLDAATGVLMATRKEVFESVGGWDEKLAINYNDVDYGLRVRASGYEIIFEPRAQIYHLESASRNVSAPHKREELELIRRLTKYNLPSYWPGLSDRDEQDSPTIGFDYYYGSVVNKFNCAAHQK